MVSIVTHSPFKLLVILVRKDLITEWRRTDFVFGLMVLSLFIGVATSVGVGMIALPHPTRLTIASFLIWLHATFITLVASEKMWAKEVAADALSTLALARVPGQIVFVAKATLLSCCSFVSLAIITVSAVLLSDLRLPGSLGSYLLIGSAGAVGLGSITTLTSILSLRAERGAVLQMLVTLPLLIPFVIALERATIDTIEQRGVFDFSGATVVVFALALIYPALGMLLSERALGDTA